MISDQTLLPDTMHTHGCQPHHIPLKKYIIKRTHLQPLASCQPSVFLQKTKGDSRGPPAPAVADAPKRTSFASRLLPLQFPWFSNPSQRAH